MAESKPAAGWYQDPTGLGDGRYWDGVVWTHSVHRDGVTISVPIDEARAMLPPASGSQTVAPVRQVTAPTVAVPTPSRSPVGAIVGAVLAVLVVVLVVVLISGNNSSNDDPPPETTPPATEAPAAADAPADDG